MAEALSEAGVPTIQTDLAKVKTDLAEVKTDLGDLNQRLENR